MPELISNKEQVKYSQDEIRELICKDMPHIKPEAISIHYNLTEEYDPGDWQSRYPPTTVFDSITVTIDKTK